MDGLSQLSAAKGLRSNEADMINRMVERYDHVQSRNKKLMEFYKDKNPVKFLGIAVDPNRARQIGCRTGWAAKSCEYLSSRSVFDGFTSTSSDIQSVLKKFSDENKLSSEYAKAVIPELVYGCGFWTLSNGQNGEPDVVVNYHNATTGSVLMNYRTKEIKAGFFVNDAEQTGKNGAYEPTEVVLHTANNVVTINKSKNGWKVSDKLENFVGRPLMDVMTYRPTDEVLGKSRITPAVQDIITEAQNEIIRMGFQSEVSSAPLRYLLGVSEEAFKADKYSLAYNAMLLATRDQNGEVPQIGQLSAPSPEGHIKIMEHLMGRMSGETGIPVAALGLTSNGYTSADALRASTSDIILEAEALNTGNGESLQRVAYMALALADGRATYDEVKQAGYEISVHWKDPSMPTAAAMADSSAKLASVAPAFAETDVFWEMNGMNQDQRTRIDKQMRDNNTRAAMNAIFAKAE